MWRSLMARSQFLLSHLRLPTASTTGDVVVVAANRKLIHSPRAYASDTTSVPDLVGTAAPPKCKHGSAERTSAASSNRHSQGCCCCCCGRRPRRHLYVVLDEINTGHSVYKLDVDDLDGSDEDAVARWNMDKAPAAAPPPPPQRLPETTLRLGVSLVGSGPRFEAMGNKIVIMGVSRTVDIYNKKNDEDDFDHDDDHSGDNEHGDDTMITLVYNTETAKLDIGRPTLERLASRYIAASSGDKLYMLVSDEPPLYLVEESVMPNLRCGSRRSYESGLSSLRGQINEWAWKRSPTPLPLVAAGGGQRVISYAVHPDGRTIFASASTSLASPSFTFSFDSSKGGEPTRHHDWCLPFHGRAYYDGDLDAWVGIRKGDDTEGRTRGRHYLCSCDVPDLGNDPATPLSEPAAWKMCEEELTFLDEPEYEYLDGAITSPTLVHTGRGRFCLVEVMLAPSGSHCTCLQDGVEHLLLLTMFRAKHGKDGKLVVAPCRPGRSYLVPNYCYDYLGPPPAFWM